MSVKDLIQKITGKATEQEAPTADETQAAFEALEARETALATQEAELATRTTALNDQEADLSQREGELTGRMAAVEARETAVTEKETALTTLETALTEKETNLDANIAEAAQKLSIQGTAPVKPEAKDSSAEILAAYAAEKDPAKRVALFQKNEAVLRKAGLSK